VVVRSTPFHRTLDPETKLLPVTVRVKAGPPAVVEDGVMLVMIGTGLEVCAVKVTALDVPPPGVGVKTVILAVQGDLKVEA
jgi:hypothetical protein